MPAGHRKGHQSENSKGTLQTHTNIISNVLNSYIYILHYTHTYTQIYIYTCSYSYICIPHPESIQKLHVFCTSTGRLGGPPQARGISGVAENPQESGGFPEVLFFFGCLCLANGKLVVWIKEMAKNYKSPNPKLPIHH